MRESFLVFGSPLIDEAAIDEVVDSMRSGWLGSGPKVERFERLLESYNRVPHVRCLASCTAALMLGLRCIGVGPGDEVIVPAMTFVATANAVEHAGATTVLVDSDPDTGLIDLDAVEAAITPHTRAFIPVHFAGRPLDMDRVNDIRDRHDLVILEDAAHAIGAAWRGTRIGGHGNLTAYSFYITKNITTVEGGALATEDADEARRVEQLAMHGLSAGAWKRFSDQGFRHYEVVEPGFKYNMTDIQAAIGLHQLPHLDEWVDRRAELWEAYDEALRDLPLVTPSLPTAEMRHARHLYAVQVTDDSRLRRDELLNGLTEQNIGTGVHYRGVHLHPYYRDRYGIGREDLPHASDISDRTLSLPLGAKMSSEDLEDVVDALHHLLS